MNNMDKLGEILARQMKKTVRANRELGMELGKIQSAWRDGREVLDLVSDSLRQTIPQGSYSTLSGVSLYPGDRVVVAWLGYEPVVLGTLVST